MKLIKKNCSWCKHFARLYYKDIEKDGGYIFIKHGICKKHNEIFAFFTVSYDDLCIYWERIKKDI
ncbi:MAG: hypothetical protein FWE03_02570 [Firmicutes bacterium]|nr:hypothetical protein [Bacillota bacterium]